MSDRKLNPQQLKAIEHKSGPLLIIAGAGTGKTTVITERIKYLIEKDFAKSSEILALTFTEKAAREMEERVDIALPYGYTQMWISTFHSFGDRILRREGLQIGLDPKYKLLSSAENIQLLRHNLFEFDLTYFRPLGNPHKFIAGLCQHFSRLQDEDILPKDYLVWAKKNKDPKYLELANAYEKYEELKTRDGLMDYGDLIVKLLQLFRERPNVLTEYKKQFKYILVDEFQDTNIAQYELIKLLAEPKSNPNLTVVGDDSQSVYKFRGAAVSNILNLKRDYQNVTTLVLTENYRSTQNILDASYKLIKNNDPDTLEIKLGVDKKLKSNIPGDEQISFLHCSRVENEAEKVAQEIEKLIASGKYGYRDFAILVRANNHAEPFMRALDQIGIPYQFLGPGKLFKQPEILDLVSYLRVLYNFEDSLSFYRLLSADFMNINGRDLAVLGNFARKNNLSLFEVCEPPTLEALASQGKISNESKIEIDKLIKLINKHFDLMKRESAGQLVYYFLEEFKLLEKLLNPKDSESQKKATTISKFFDKLKTYETDHENASVFNVVDWIDISSEIGESPLSADSDWNSVDAVNILTVHGSKGLEFPVVFLVNLVSLRFPSTERREQIPIPDEIVKEVLPSGDSHMQEERRLFYVGMTRAKKLLYFTAADYYGEGKRDKKLSPFILESLGDSYQSEKQNANKSQNSNFVNSKTEKSRHDLENNLKISKAWPAPLVNFLSYSQIETFLVCPLHYKLRYILKIPTPPSAAMTMGIAMHETMKNIYEAASEGKKITTDLANELLVKNWSRMGFKSKKHELEMQSQAKNYLTNYLTNDFNPKKIPVLLEKDFVIPISDDLKIRGKIDRVDLLPDGRVEIIDYKTGSPPDPKYAQREIDKLMHQLSFYALAATTLRENIFPKKPEEISLSLYFFENGQKYTTTRTREQLEELKKEILKIRDEIQKSDFKCSGNYLCQFCEFGMFCNSKES